MQPTEDHDTPEATGFNLQLPNTWELDLSHISPGDYLAVVDALRLNKGPSGYPYYEVTFSLSEPGGYGCGTVWKILSFAPAMRRKTLAWLDTIAGHEIPRARVNLDDAAFQQQFLQRWVRLRIGVNHDPAGLAESSVDAISPAPQPSTLPSESRERPELRAQHPTPAADSTIEEDDHETTYYTV